MHRCQLSPHTAILIDYKSIQVALVQQRSAASWYGTNLYGCLHSLLDCGSLTLLGVRRNALLGPLLLRLQGGVSGEGQ